MSPGTATATDRTVLVVLHEEVLGGATLSVLRTVPHLEERGWQFAFWVPRPSELYDHLRSEGRRVHGADRHVFYSIRALRLPPGPAARLRSLPPYFLALASFARRIRPALAHVNSLLTLTDGLLMRTLGIPVLLHVHEMVANGAKGRLAGLAARTIATEPVAVSLACASALGSGRHLPRIVYEGAELPGLHPVRRPSDAHGFTVGTIGVISRRKGSDLFAEAARIVQREDPSIGFEMIGAPTDALDSEWARGVLRRAADAGVAHSSSTDVPSTLARWDLFVLPSRRDPFPIAMLEAMAAGLPCIGTRVDGIEEQLAGECGVLVEPDDPASLAKAILELRRAPGRRRALGAAACRRVRQRFTVAHQAEALDRAYRATVGSAESAVAS